MWRPRFRGTPRPAPAAGRRCFRAGPDSARGANPACAGQKARPTSAWHLHHPAGDPDLKDQRVQGRLLALVPLEKGSPDLDP